MFAISRKVATLRLMFFGVIIAAVVSIAGMLAIKSNDTETSATTRFGDTVSITMGGTKYTGLVMYNSSDGLYGSTHYYYVNGELAYCVNVNKQAATGTFNADRYTTTDTYGGVKKDDLIKFMIYVYNHRGEAIANNVFAVGSWVDNSVQGQFVDFTVDDETFEGYIDDYYAYTHAIIGYIYDGAEMDDMDYDYVRRAIGILIDNINGDTEAWRKARTSSIFRATPPSHLSGMQDIVWLEEPVRGDLKFRKIDASNSEASEETVPMQNVVFKLSRLDENNRIVESHIVVSDENGIVDTAANPHSENTNGYDELFSDGIPINYEGYGTWFSKVGDEEIAVEDFLGALPFGTYIVEEQRCDANRFCYGLLNQHKTFTIDDVHVNIDLGDWDNECVVFKLDTLASDPDDNDNYIEDGVVTIKDTIEYCVKPNTVFKIKGILMDKETGEPLLIDGQEVTSSIDEVTTDAQDGCGIAEMFFTFDATGLGGKELVVFESLYYGDELITEHANIDDPSQTIGVLSLHTHATNKETGEKTLPYGEDVIIKDVVTYCLKPGIEYTFESSLMNKETKEIVEIDGKPVTKIHIFTPEESCGEFEMEYELNTEDLAGVELVIFENLYIDGELVVEHKDFENEHETVVVETPVPDTGYLTKTTTSNNSEINHLAIFAGAVIIITFGGYATKRVMARRRW